MTLLEDLEAATPAELAELERRDAWLQAAREEQKTPLGTWHTWLYLAGRGSGKTRAAAEDVAWYGITHPDSFIAVVAETFSDARDVCIEGESGLISCLPEESIQHWNRSIGELFLTNGAKYKVYSGDKPDGLRGYQHHRAWTDELAKFRYAKDTWTQLQLGLRLGDDPRNVVTTTPRPMALLKDLMHRDNVHVTRGSTFDNAANLAPAFLEEVRRAYEGTRVGRQELHGEYLDDVPGALWTRQMVEDAHISNTHIGEPSEMERVVVAVDPAGTAHEESDETGIVVAGKGIDGRAYVLADRTCRLSPDGWARRATAAYDEFSADRLVAETNFGADMVERVIRTVAPRISYKKLTASRGKRQRAEPVAALYEQHRVSHVGAFPELEDQMCMFTPEGMDGSPDRVDALVWALSELMLDRQSAEVFSF